MSDTSPKISMPNHYTSAPVIFCDGVASASVGPGIIKFYLIRADPDIDGDQKVVTTAAAQIVMPLDGFLSTVVFFQERLEHYIKSGLISQEQVDERSFLVRSAP